MRKLNITAGAGSCPALNSASKDNYYFDGFYLDETQTEYPTAVNITTQKDMNLFAVCDGEGTNSFTASYYAMDYLDKYNDQLYCDDAPDWDFILKNYLSNVNRIIFTESERSKNNYGIRATVCGFDEEYFYGAGVGDCAVFLLRDGDLTELTDSFDKKAILGKSDVAPEVSSISKTKLKDGDRILMLNAEASSALDKQALIQLLHRDDDISKNINDIIKAAVESGAKENVTAILIRSDSNSSSSFLARKSGSRLIMLIFALLLATVAAIVSLYFALDESGGNLAFPFL